MVGSSYFKTRGKGSRGVKPIHFNQWIVRRISDFGFEDSSDFYRKIIKTKGRPKTDFFPILGENNGKRGRRRTDYLITMYSVGPQMSGIGGTRHGQGAGDGGAPQNTSKFSIKISGF